jgi:5-methylcytosine-specific restriction endonuclease McrA
MAEVLNSSVLVLNKQYRPVNIINARRAFCMLFGEIAEVITYEDSVYCTYDFRSWAEISGARRQFDNPDLDWVNTPRLSLIIPRIIRLLAYDKVRVYHAKLTRRNIYYRDINTCQYCGRRFRNADLNIDHVVPKSRGGHDTWENLVCACVPCNIRKGSKTPKEAGMTLVRKPFEPALDPMISLHIGKRKYASWRAFLDDAYWNVELAE